MKKLKITKQLVLCLSVFSCAMVFYSDGASAATKTWDGGGGADTNFSNPQNWSDNTLPASSGDSFVFPAPTIASYTVTQNMSYDMDNVTVLPGSTNNFSVNFVSTAGLAIFGELVVGDHQSITFSSPLSTARLETTVVRGGVDSDITFSLIFAGLIGVLALENSTGITQSTPIEDLPQITFSRISGSFSSPTDPLTVNSDSVHSRFTGNNPNADLAINATDSIVEISDSAAIGGSASPVALINSQLLFSGASAVALAKPVSFEGNLFGKTTGLLGYEASYATNNASPALSGAVTLQSDIVVNPNLSSPISFTGSIQGDYMISVSQTLGPNQYLVINADPNESKLPNGKYGVVISNAVYDDDKPDVDLYVHEGNTVTVNGMRRNVILEKNTILKGSGKVSAVTINDGVHIAPGNSPGCLSAGGTVFSASSSLDIEIAGSAVCSEYDQLKVAGAVNLNNATLNLTILSDFMPAKGSSFTILDNDGADAIAGTFKDLPEGAAVRVGNTVFKISYTGGDGNDVVLVAESVPSAPSTGIQLLSANPLLTLILTSLSATVLFVLAKQCNRQ